MSTKREEKCVGYIGLLFFDEKSRIVINTLGYIWVAVIVVLINNSIFSNKEQENSQSPTKQMISAAFSKWSASTVERGVVLDWRGDKSAVLYVEHQTYARTRLGGSHPDTWVVWARTQSGNLYKVRMIEPESAIRKQSYALPMDANQEELLEVLVRNGEFALIDELKLPRKAA